MGTTIKIFDKPDDLSQYFAQRLADHIQHIPEDKYFTIALSGGSTPRKVFEYLALHYRDQINWKKVLVFWNDERCVNPESDESNYKMAKESLLDHVPVPTENIFRIHGEADPETEALRYADLIRKHVESFNSIPRFDLMMLGMGEDGHTVSIFPGNLHLFNSENLCAVSEHPISKQKRITVTGQILNQAAMVAFLVCGESKAEMLARVIERKIGWETLPASMVSPGEGELIWLLDKGAAGKLNKQLQQE